MGIPPRTMGRPETGELNLEELESRVEALRQSIQRLGTVHVGVLEEYGVEMIGARADVIAKAEERDQFKAAMEKIATTASDKPTVPFFHEEVVQAAFRSTMEEDEEEAQAAGCACQLL